MLKIYFGEKDKSIYNTSVYFKNQYNPKWLKDEFARRVIKEVDQTVLNDDLTLDSPVLGSITPNQLSGGVKTLILIKNNPGKLFNASNCGNNCASFLLELGNDKDYTINLYHIMDFGKGDFEIKIMNNRTVVHNMNELIEVAVQYL